MVLGAVVLIVAIGSYTKTNKSAVHLAAENDGLFLIFAFPAGADSHFALAQAFTAANNTCPGLLSAGAYIHVR